MNNDELILQFDNSFENIIEMEKSIEEEKSFQIWAKDNPEDWQEMNEKMCKDFGKNLMKEICNEDNISEESFWENIE